MMESEAIESLKNHKSDQTNSDYDENQLDMPEEPKKKTKRKEDTLSYKAKNFFSNFFD